MPFIQIELKTEDGVHYARDARNAAFHKADREIPDCFARVQWYLLADTIDKLEVCSATDPDVCIIKFYKGTGICRAFFGRISDDKIYAPLGFGASTQSLDDRTSLVTVRRNSLYYEIAVPSANYTHICVYEDLVTLWKDVDRKISQSIFLFYLRPAVRHEYGHAAILCKTFVLGKLNEEGALFVHYSPLGVYKHGQIYPPEPNSDHYTYSTFLHLAITVQRFMLDPLHFPDADSVLVGQFQNFAKTLYYATELGNERTLRRLNSSVPDGSLRSRVLFRVQEIKDRLRC